MSLQPKSWWYVRIGDHYVTRVHRDSIELVARYHRPDDGGPPVVIMPSRDAQEFDTAEGAEFIARKYGGSVEEFPA